MKTIFAIIPTLIITALLAIGLSSPSTQANQSQNTQIQVVVTTSHIADLVENLNPGNLKVTSLMGTGVDPHLFKPTASDIAKLSRADIVIYNGLHLEGQMVELLETMSKKKPVLALADHLTDTKFLESEAFSTSYDPHIWMDVSLWRRCAAATTHILKHHDPVHSTTYDTNLSIYDAELQNLDLYIRHSIASIPEKQRILVTAHDAFGYFGKAYTVNVIGIQGLSTESEAGLKHMRDISELITERKVPAVFGESSVSRRNIEALRANTRHNGFNVALGDTLFSDSLGSKDTPESRYIGMMVHNTKSIVSGLGGITTAYIGLETLATAQQ